jgi:parvulin-like peptidyl-prolyl isomerase
VIDYVRYFLFFILIIAFGACSIKSSQQPPPASPSIVNVPVEQTIETVPERPSEQPTPTTNQEETVANKAFEGGQPLAARVNEQPIFLDAYEKQVSQLEQALIAQGVDITSQQGQEMLAQIQQQVLDSLIDQVIIELEANKLGLTVSEETLEAKTQESITKGPGQAEFEEWLAANNLTYEEFKANLRSELLANQVFETITNNVPETAEQIEMRQILVADDTTAWAIIEQLKNGTEFSTLVQEYSIDENSRANEGNLGWFPRGLGLIPPEVEEVAFSIEPGQVSGPIKSPLGFHIIKLENREMERPLEDMRQALKQQIFIKWLAKQRSLTTIEKYVGL